MKRAIFIIACNYRGIRAVRPLNVGEDMINVGEFFGKEAGYHYREISQDDPRDVVLAKLSRMARRLESGDLLVIYFAGHGLEAPEHMLVLPAGPDQGDAQIAFLPVQELRRRTDGLGLTRALILDCCRNNDATVVNAASDYTRKVSLSDTGLPPTRDIGLGPVARPQAKGATGSFAIFCACSHDDVAPELGDTGRGLFSTALRAVLRRARAQRRAVKIDDVLRADVEREMIRLAGEHKLAAPPKPYKEGNATPEIMPAAGRKPLAVAMAVCGLLVAVGIAAAALYVRWMPPLHALEPQPKLSAVQPVETRPAHEAVPPVSRTNGPNSAAARASALLLVIEPMKGLPLTLVRCPPSAQAAGALPAFFLIETPITNAQFRAFVKDAGYVTVAEREERGWVFPVTPTDKLTIPQDEGRKVSWRDFTGDDLPVVMVCRADAEAYCRWLQQKTSYAAKLPSADQRDFAALAGSHAKFWWGDNVLDGAGKMNCADESLQKIHPRLPTLSLDDGFAFRSPVRQFAPNPWGLYDMFGNVQEWTADDPADQPGSGIVAGGSWQSTADRLQATVQGRVVVDADFRNDRIGFRVMVPDVAR